MTAKRIVLIIIGLALLGGYLYGLVWSWSDYISNKDVIVTRLYQGRIYLQVDEYSEFKTYLVEHPEITIIDMEVLPSPDPLIDFTFKAPVETQVPYGEIIRETKGADLFFPLLITIVGAFVVSYCFIPIIISWKEK